MADDGNGRGHGVAVLQELTRLTVAPATDHPAAVSRIACAEPFDVLGYGDALDLVDGCALFDVLDGEGRPVASFSLRVDQFRKCRVITVTGAGGSSAAGAVDAMAAFCEAEADRIGADLVTCQTRRPGLVRLLGRRGFRVAGYLLSKG